MTWFYNGVPVSEPPAGYCGFVYLLTDRVNGKKYIGKKGFYTTRRLPPLKGKTRRRVVRTESDWKEYSGSNATTKELGPDRFKREILRFCRTKSEMSYYETKELFDRDAILSPDFYNDWVTVKVTRKHMGSVISE